MQTISQNLKKVLKKQNIKISTLAKTANLSQSAIKNILKSKCIIRDTTLIKLAIALNVSTDSLLKNS